MSDGVRVWDYVAKHGSHSQASHAGGKGGAAAGGAGAGGDNPDRNKQAYDAHAAANTGVSMKLNNANLSGSDKAIVQQAGKLNVQLTNQIGKISSKGNSPLDAGRLSAAAGLAEKISSKMASGSSPIMQTVAQNYKTLASNLGKIG